MAGSGQAPTPYDGMGTPTRMDMRTHEDGTPAERFEAVRAERHAPGDDALPRRKRRLRAQIAQPLLPVISARTDRRSGAVSAAAALLDGATEPARLLTGAQVALESLIREGVDTIFGYPGGANLWLYRYLPDYPAAAPHPGPPRTGWRACRRRLRAQQAWFGRRGLRDERSRSAQPRDGTRDGLHGLGPGGRHHRPGAEHRHRNRQLPGVGRHRLDDVGRQALLSDHQG